jgi:hypothetical protein
MSSLSSQHLEDLSNKWKLILDNVETYTDSALAEPMPKFTELPRYLIENLESRFRDLPTLQVGFEAIKESVDTYQKRLLDIREREQYVEMEKTLNSELVRLVKKSQERAHVLKREKDRLEEGIKNYDSEVKKLGKEANTVAANQVRMATLFEKKMALAQGKIFSNLGVKMEVKRLNDLGMSTNLEPRERTKFSKIFNELNRRTEALVRKVKTAEDHLEQIGINTDEHISKLDINDQDVSVLEDKFKEVDATAELIGDTLESLKMDLQFAKGESKQTRQSNCATSSETGPTISDRPCVEIFELKPPPSVNLNNFSNYRELQRYVGDNFSRFAWPPFDWKTGGECKIKNKINNLQKLSYHYMQPYNANLNVLLAHSAGSGKTCTALLIASIFARQGYTPLIVTKSTLKPIYMKEAFKNGCDFNMQQYLKFKKVKQFDDLFEEEEDLDKEYVRVLKKMGVHFEKKFCIMTYNEFSRIAQKTTGENIKASKKRLEFFRKNPNKRAVTGDPIANCVVIVDEAHKLVARSTDLNPSEQGDFLAMQKLIWNSRKMSKDRAARIVLLTATPIADSPTDLINLLSLLGTEEEANTLRLLPRNYRPPQREKNGSSVWEGVKTVMEHNFIRDYVDYDGNLKDSARNKLQRLGMGRISYFNYSGDGNRFARPEVSWVNVNLTNFQATGVEKCFKEFAGLRYDHRTGNWDSGRKAVGNLLFEDSSSEDVNAWLYENASKPTSSPDRKVNIDKLKMCVSKNYNWPKKKNDKALGLFRDTQNAPGMKNLEDLASNSTVLARLMQNVRSDKIESKIMLKEFYRHEAPPDEPLMYMKQFIFTDLVGPTKNTDLYGVDLISAWLKKAGYKAINRSTGSGSDTKLFIDGPEKRNLNPYKNMIVLNKYWKGRKLDELLDVFNSRDNIDGREAYLILVNGSFKEGISLTQVGYIHIVGYVSSRADLVQAVARGIRNCKHEGLPFYPNQGWPVKVQIYNPVFPERSKWGKSQYSPEELIKSLSPESDKVKAQMKQIVQDIAYDKLLLAPINNLSQEISNQIQLKSP